MSPPSVPRLLPRAARTTHKGLVLPLVLVLLLALVFVGLLAARRAATVEEVGNNVRVNQVATQAAQSGLAYCEAVVIDAQGGGTQFSAAIHGLVQSKTLLTGPEDKNANWDTLANWGDSSTVRITVPVAAGKASNAMNGAPVPYCMAEALAGGQFLITARGLSAGATFNNDGQLQGGSEVWLQSIITPKIPVRSAEGGIDYE